MSKEMIPKRKNHFKIPPELKIKYSNSKWSEAIELALKLSKSLENNEKAFILEWAAWAAALKGDEKLRKRLHRKAAIIWEQLAIESQTALEKARYYSRASWNFNYHDNKRGSLIDLTIDQEAKTKCRRMAARYWKNVSKRIVDAEEKARYLGRAATYYFLLHEKKKGDKFVNLTQKAWTDLSLELDKIKLSSIEPLSEEYIEDVVSLEDGIPNFPFRSFEKNVQRTENYRRWVESWVLKYKPVRIQLCFIERVKSPVAYSWIEPKSKLEVELHSLMVRKAFRRRGIATSFLIELFKKFWRANFETILLGVGKSNISAMKLYEKLGFDITNDGEDFYDMKLRLASLLGEK